MPQFDFSQALPQILWLVLVFAVLYLAARAMVPRVEAVVASRQERIAADLRAAEAARQTAEAETAGGSSALGEARLRALALTGSAREQAAAAVAARLAEAGAALDERVAAQSASIAAAHAAAVAELDGLVAEATRDLVQRVAGLQVDAAEAEAAVQRVAA